MFTTKEDSNGLFWAELNGEIFDGPFLYVAEAEERKNELNNDK